MKKKEEFYEQPEDNTRPPSNVRKYFTKEVNDRIYEMTDKRMEATLKDLINGDTWIAILKYTGKRTPLLDSVLTNTDPIKDPSKISWAQGCKAGLSDLESYVIDLNAPKETPESE